VGEVLMNIRKADANAPTISSLDWKAVLEYNLYGDPTVSLVGEDPAYKSDVVFLLDSSGSMVSPEPGKWQAAVDAAVLFRDLIEALRFPDFEDRYNSVVFRWLIPGHIDGTTTVPSPGMKPISTALSASTFNPTYTPDPPYMTPIGLGLQLAASQFETGTLDSLYTDKLIILLSDGKHNAGVAPLDVVRAPEWPGAVKVFSVGLGEDDIEPETIERIADATYGDYRISPSPREIEGFFCEIFTDMSWKLQDITVISNTVSIDQDEVVFIVIWDDTTLSPGFAFELDPPSGANITPTSPGSYCTYYPPTTGSTHAFYACDGLPSTFMGTWHFVNINSGGTPIPLSDVLLKVIEDPRTIADFDIENADHYTGQPLILTAKITEDGKPKTGLTEVYADLTRAPALAIGELLAENSPPWNYPAHPPAQTDLTLRSHYLLGVMNRIDLKSLSKHGEARIYLRDDGLDGDSRADDGVYTGIFENTQYEGSYTFEFRATGKNRDGFTFDRHQTLSEYVEFAANPTDTEVVFVSTVVDREKKVIRATIKVVPRDAFGAHLGPFRGDLIQLWSSAGEFEPSYEDNRDGSYSFVLTYPTDTVPLVSVSVGDVIVAERAPVELERRSPTTWLLLILVMLVIILIWLIPLLYRRRAVRRIEEE
jgi:hypothetical protein